jgi:hypothetical protein
MKMVDWKREKSCDVQTEEDEGRKAGWRPAGVFITLEQGVLLREMSKPDQQEAGSTLAPTREDSIGRRWKPYGVQYSTYHLPASMAPCHAISEKAMMDDDCPAVEPSKHTV